MSPFVMLIIFITLLLLLTYLAKRLSMFVYPTFITEREIFGKFEVIHGRLSNRVNESVSPRFEMQGWIEE